MNKKQVSAVMLVCLLTLSFGFVACDMDEVRYGKRWKFEVTGNASSVSIDYSYNNSSGSYNVGLPWSHEFFNDNKGPAQISVRASDYGETFTVKIYRDGKVVASGTDSYPYIVFVHYTYYP